MNTSVCFRTVILVSAVAWPWTALSTSHAADKPGAGSDVALFDAQASGQLAVKFVPASEKKGTLTLANRTRAPLTIRVPDTMGAVPVLGQFQPQPQPQPQPLGLSRPPAARGDRAFQQVAWGKAPSERVVVLAPGGQVRLPLQGVCLQFGNPTPNSRMRYDLVPLERVTKDSRVVAALQSMAEGRNGQEVVQAVAWHVANGKSWKSLGSEFSKREVQAAQQLLQEVSAPPAEAPATPAPKSASEI